MEPWFILALAAMIGYGVQHFLFKVAAENGYNSIRVNTVFMLTVAAISGIFYLLSDAGVSGPYFLLFVLANAITYLLANICKIESYRFSPATVAAPISKMYVALTPLLAYFIFRERITITQLIGLTLATFAVVTLTHAHRHETKKFRGIGLGLVFAGAAAASTSFNNLIGKSAAASGDIMSFIFFSYLASFALALGLQKLVNREERPIRELARNPGAIRLGIIIGIVNFISYYLLLTALTQGKAMVIFPLIGIGIAVTLGLAIWIYGEKLNREKVIGIGSCIAAAVLLA